MGVKTALVSVPSNAAVGNHSLELQKLLPENSLAFEITVPSVEKLEGDVFGDKNLSEEITGEVKEIVESSFVDDQIVYDKKLIEEKNSEVFEKVGLVVADVDDECQDYKKLIEEDPWNYDMIEVDEEELQRRHPLSKFVPRKRRTRRYVVGEINYDREKGVYYYADSSVIKQREELRKSTKLDRGKEIVYYPDSSMMMRKSEESRKLKNKVWFAENDDAEASIRSQMIKEKEELRQLKKRARYLNYSCWDDDAGPSNKKRARDLNYSYWDDGAGPSNKKQKQKKVPKRKQHDDVNQGPPPELPDQFRNYVDNLNLAEPPMFFGRKILTPTDLNPHQSRLSFPRPCLRYEFFENFLTKDEDQMLKSKVRIRVRVVDDNLHVYDTLQLARWLTQSGSSFYVLTTDWNRFAAEHRLEENMVVQCWGFHVDSRLCFCLAVNRDCKKEEESAIKS